ncbi:MAG: aminotransferase class I/II-fold pyridoxal phosphate-dependent enzyme [Chloroflexi bacterium]|nr:MAG: aminotransferase class I/II-fold pyridoxal phosphate-dependent enzyme [Chloroflexota bacterium]
MTVIDLRSDTVAMPSQEMRQAMATAPLGDDVFGDDPTTNQLMKVAADRMGKEGATFVPSGTMGNLIGIAVNAQRGQELIADADSHAFYYETAGAAAVCGVQIRAVPTEGGVMSPQQIVDAVRPRDDTHQPISAAVTFENTHNRHGGVAWPLEDLRAASEAAHAHGLRVHLDGARIFNAAVALDVPAAEIAACADTVTFCLSKGLACPVGSIFCGSQDDIEEAKRWRKRLGGGMRQVGVLAAAGLIALDRMVDRLAEDHANARTLAEGLAELPGVKCDLRRVQTNLVYFDLESMPAQKFTDECTRRGLLSAPTGARQVRFVTHYGIDAGDVQSALQICEEVLTA